MKKHPVVLLVLLISCLIVCAIRSFGQKGFGMEEKQLVEKWKRSNARFLKGKQNFIKKKYDKAETELKSCLEILPQHADAYFFLAQIDSARNDFSQALVDIEQAKKNYTFIGQLFVFIQTERMETLRDEKARLQSEAQAYQDQLNRATSDEERQRVRALLSQAQNQLSAVAVQLNQPLPDEMKIPADYHYIHGNALFKLNRFQEAHDQYVQTINSDPKHAGAYNNLINLYYMAKDYEGALKYVNQAEASGVELNEKLKDAVLKAAGK